MIDRPVQHLQNRQDEGQHHKKQQGGDQQKGAALGAGLRRHQRRLQRAAIGGGQKRGACLGGGGRIGAIAATIGFCVSGIGAAVLGWSLPGFAGGDEPPPAPKD